MRLFIYEYACAQATHQPDLPASLVREGWAMLSSLIQDFTALPGLEVITLLSPGFPHECHCRGVTLRDGFEEAIQFLDVARLADLSLVIAPETDGLLAERTLWLESARQRHLGCASAAVRLTGDKLLLARHLQARGLPTPATEALSQPAPAYPCVIKPRDGAGSQATFLVHSAQEEQAALLQAAREGQASEMIRQPWVSGTAASVAFLVGPSQLLPMVPALQRLSGDGRFHYEGGRLPLPAEQAQRALRLATQAAQAVAGLRGFVGVDLVIGEHEDCIIEINPRVTTSYVGLRQLAASSLAAAWLDVAYRDKTASITWADGPIEFTI